MFVDHLKVYARAGNGGNGIVHWIRAKFLPKGGPDGGDGGRGGNVILEVDTHTDSLRSLFYNPKIIATDGQSGGRRQMTGRGGKDKICKVPAGTVVYARTEDGEPGEMIADLVHIGERFVLCKGGKGGKGNMNFKTATNRAPEEHTLGVPGEEGHYFFELRKIADAGMVGFPNAGKSSLVAALSAAKPKIAAYPFTTLQPMVGIIDYPGFLRTSVADIPGLIEGAHENRGLGHEFLRHIMRCRVLLFVLDMGGVDGRDPMKDLASLRTEVSLYNADLAKQEWIIIANKMDLEGAAENLKALKRKYKKIEIIPTSTLGEPGLQALRDRLSLLALRPG